MTTATTKLGKTRAGEHSRIWLEGQRLADAGFTPGKTFLKVTKDDRLVLRLSDNLDEVPRSAWGTVSGKGTRPIVDIVGALVTKTFAGCTHVSVTYATGRITIAAGESP